MQPPMQGTIPLTSSVRSTQFHRHPASPRAAGQGTAPVGLSTPSPPGLSAHHSGPIPAAGSAPCSLQQGTPAAQRSSPSGVPELSTVVHAPASTATAQFLKAPINLKALSWPPATAQPTELCPSLGTHGDAPGQGTVLSREGRGGGCVAQTWHLGVPLAAPHPRSAGCPPHSSILCPSSPQHPPQVPRAPSSVGPPLQELLINVNWEQPRSTGGKSL